MDIESYSIRLGGQLLIALDVDDLNRREVMVKKLKQLGATETFKQIYSIPIDVKGVNANISNISDQLESFLIVGDKILFLNAGNNDLDGKYLLARENQICRGIKVISEP